MGDNLEKVGVRAVVEGASPFNRAIDSLNKKLGDFQKQTQSAAKSASPLDKALGKLGISVSGLQQKFLEMSGASGNIVNALTQILGALGPLGLAIAAATAAVAGFIALGMRGANLRGLAESFDLLTASVGVLSSALLTDLRRAAAGTVSDFDLMRAANLALAGATGEFGQAFAQNLPRILEIARAQARATGQDVNYLFDSLVRGIKRSSPMLIDNTGLVLKIGEANEAYAQSLGKTVDQLTQQEQQMAILQATLDAGAAAIEMSGQIQETAAEKLARAGATVTNIFDKLALAVQPAFEGLLDVLNRVLTAIDGVLTAIMPIVSAIVTFLVQPLVDAGRAIMDFFEPMITVAQQVIPYFVAGIQMIGEAISGLFSFLSISGGDSLFAPITDPIRRAAKFLTDPNTRRAFFFGAARMIGSLAAGILNAANQYVFPAIISIARFIANFLSGSSPPPMGPLSTINKGGANLMMAWLEGITGVSLDPVKKVAGEVAAALGTIGTMSREQVEKRLAQLDRALQPFSDRLAIVKSQFDALREPAEAALRAIDRQMETAVQALLAGDEQAAATVRALDSQREAIEGALSAQQGMVDAAQLQLSLATAQQARERTLLEIRKRMLGPVTAAVKKAKEAAGGKLPKEEKPKAGEAPAPAAGGAPVGLPEGAGTDVLDLIGGQGAIDEARLVLEAGFASGLGTAGEEFQNNIGLLQTEMGRIGKADIGGRIAKSLSGIRDQLDTALNEAFEGIRHFFVDPGEGTLDGLLKSAENWFIGLPARIVTSLALLWTTLSESEPIVALRNFFTLQTEDATSLYGILTAGVGFFQNFPTRITDALSTLWQQIVDGPLAPLVRFFGDTGEEYTLKWFIDEAVRFFTELPNRLTDALRGLGLVVWNSIAVPVISTINSIITAVESALNAIRNAAADVLDQSADVLSVALSLLPGLAGIDVHNLAAGLRGSAVSLPRLTLEPPAGLLGAARGGSMGAGSYIAGERGRELITAAGRTSVFPARATAALEAIAAVIPALAAQSAPLPIPGGNSYSDDHSMNMTFNGVSGNRDAVRRWRVARAMGR